MGVTPERRRVRWSGVRRRATDRSPGTEVAELPWQLTLDSLPGVSISSVTADGAQRALTGLTHRVQSWQFDDRLHGGSGRDADSIAEVTALVERARAGETAAAEHFDAATSTTLLVTAIPMSGVATPSSSVLVISRDVTVERRSESESDLARRYADRLFQEAPHGKLLVTVDGIIRRVNPALTQMITCPAESLVDQSLWATPLAPVLSAAELRELSDGSREQVNRENVIELAQGGETHISVRAVDVPDPDSDLEPAVLMSIIDVTERKHFEQQLAHLAEHDPLTGLANRRRFDAELSSHLDRCRRYGAEGAVFMLDLDHFKAINDTLGHNAGDQLILSVAALLRTRLRSTDIVARLGGDEFAVLIPKADRDVAVKIAQDLVELIRTSATVLDGSRPRAVTASLGVVLIRDPQTSPHELLAAVDMTMYDAKEAGRNTYVVHDPLEFPMPRTGAQLAWATKVENALVNDQFEIHAQPIADVRTGRITGAELLIRLIDDDGQLVLPGRFLYVAERTSLILAVDEYMVRRAVELLASLRHTHPDLKISVNISGRSVGSLALAQLIPDLIREHRIDPGNLVLELTETAAVASIDSARAFVKTLHSFGCTLALDDFGAGFGSFYYLKHLTFDYLKIDGEFVSNVADNENDQLIIRSIVDIARGMGKTTVAEFVKDERTLAAITELGVDHAQGYHIGRPVRIPLLLKHIAQQSTRSGHSQYALVDDLDESPHHKFHDAG